MKQTTNNHKKMIQIKPKQKHETENRIKKDREEER